MAFIKLTQGKVAIVDDEDFEWLNQWKWHLGSDGYARRTLCIAISKGKRKFRCIYMHRVINETPEGFITDHKNENRLDNRRSNLRTVNKSQNNMNRGKQKNNQSGFKGVYLDKKRNQWVAAIRLDRKTIHLGRRQSSVEAHELYVVASKKYFGEFAHV